MPENEPTETSAGGDDTARQERVEIRRQSVHQTVGRVALLMATIPRHWGSHIRSLRTEMLPPIRLGQYQVFHDDRTGSSGFVAWALLSEEVIARLCETGGDLSPEEWHSGETAVVWKAIGPGGLAVLARTLKARHFAGRPLFALVYASSDGRGRLVEVPGQSGERVAAGTDPTELVIEDAGERYV